jgi:hypothetical protein
MSPYDPPLGDGDQFYILQNSPDGTSFPTGGHDPVYPECMSAETMIVRVGAGPEGQNVIDADEALNGGSYYDALLFGGFVGADFDPDVIEDGIGCTLTSPTKHAQLDPTYWVDARWWNAQKGRCTLRFYLANEAADESGLFCPCPWLKVNFFQGSCGLMLSLGTDNPDDVWWELDAEDLGFNAHGRSWVNVDTFDTPMSFATLKGQWHDLDIRWRCSELDTANQSQAARTLIGTSGSSLILTVNSTGVGGNTWRVKTPKALVANAPMSVAIVGTDITITLGTNGSNTVDNAKNTVALIASAVNALAAGVTATTSFAGSLFTNQTTFLSFFGGGLCDPVAANGYITVYFDGAVLFDLQNIELLLNNQADHPNWLREFWWGYFDVPGPMTDFYIYDDDAVVEDAPCCKDDPKTLFHFVESDGAPLSSLFNVINDVTLAVHGRNGEMILHSAHTGLAGKIANCSKTLPSALNDCGDPRLEFCIGGNWNFANTLQAGAPSAPFSQMLMQIARSEGDPETALCSVHHVVGTRDLLVVTGKASTPAGTDPTTAPDDVATNGIASYVRHVLHIGAFNRVEIRGSINSDVDSADGWFQLQVNGRVYVNGDDGDLIDPDAPVADCKHEQVDFSPWLSAAELRGWDSYAFGPMGDCMCLYVKERADFCNKNPVLSDNPTGGVCNPPGPGGASYDGSANGERLIHPGGADAIYVPPVGGGIPATAADVSDPQ